MNEIVLKVTPSLSRWAVVHGDLALATFDTRQEAEAAALALARARPRASTAALDLVDADGAVSAIKIF